MTHPAPEVTHLGIVAEAVLGKNTSQSASVVAVVLWLHCLSKQGVLPVATTIFQQGEVLFPLNEKQVA